MAASSEQLSWIRQSLNDTGDPPIFSDDIIQMWFAQAEAELSGYSAYIHYLRARLIGLDAILIDSTKLVNYTQNESQENLSDISKALLDLRKQWQAELDRLKAETIASADSGAKMMTIGSKAYYDDHPREY